MSIKIKENKSLLKVINISRAERYCYSLKAARDEFPLNFEDSIQIEIKTNQKVNKVEDLRVESTKNLIPDTGSKVILGIENRLKDVNYTGGYIHKAKKRCENNEPKLKRIKRNKKVSDKKAKVKLKYLQSIKLVEELKIKSIPSIIEKTIKSNRLTAQSYNQYEQQECFNFLNGSSKEEIALNLFLTASNADELKFIKEVILTPQYAKLLFSELNLNNLAR